MSSAESILYENMREVHPGAGSVKRLFLSCLAGHGNSRYLIKMYVIIFIKDIQIEWNRVFHRLYIRGGVFLYTNIA